MIEIERKFLVQSDAFVALAKSKYTITQGYISSNPLRTVRIRTKGEKGFITIKGMSSASGMSRFEWEKEITIAEATDLLQLCEKGVIKKIRYEVIYKNHAFEVDVFEGENSGLIIAEIELHAEDETFEKPEWLGQEVTNDERYYNACLSQHPFMKW
ncbi:MAG TPA: CYTH domain-containing protein [Flavobacterium sp.]|jgi:CYTH domain-containing protein